MSNTGKFSQVLADSNKNRIVQELNKRFHHLRFWAGNGSRKVSLSRTGKWGLVTVGTCYIVVGDLS